MEFHERDFVSCLGSLGAESHTVYCSLLSPLVSTGNAGECDESVEWRQET